jgi:hypothetical protein
MLTSRVTIVDVAVAAENNSPACLSRGFEVSYTRDEDFHSPDTPPLCVGNIRCPASPAVVDCWS